MLTTAADAIAMSQITSPAKPIILVSAVALIDRDGRVLLAQRPAGRSMAGLWEFPGGKVESGETPEAALIRELDEELGIDTAESCLAPLTFASHGYDDFHLLMMVFVNPFIQQPVVQHAVKLRVQGIIQHYEEREGSERVPHTQV